MNNRRRTISVPVALDNDMKDCRLNCGVPVSIVLVRLYKAWREGRVAPTGLPSGVWLVPPVAPVAAELEVEGEDELSADV
jgi:hypothetical protein